jgi:hypothetical protein
VVLARPELVQIETAFRNPKERRPEARSRNEYTVVDVPIIRSAVFMFNKTPPYVVFYIR